MSLAEPVPVVERVRVSVWIFLTLAGSTAGITLTFLAMRAVMDVGGACADGGAFEIRQQCPEGVPLLMMLGIWGGLIFVGLYAWKSFGNGVPNLVGLAWPALFLSLGWNFFEFAVSPPTGEGIVWGWLVCGVLFALMGGLPLLWEIKTFGRRFLRGEGRPAGPFAAVKPSFRPPPRTSPPKSWPTEPRPPAEEPDLVSQLERLNELHRSGGLTDAEFQAAKRRLLGGGS